jgi:hypothetical protein
MTEVEIGLAIQEAVDQFEKLGVYVSKTKKQIIQQLAEKFERAEFPSDMICAKIVEEIHEKRKLMSKSHIQDSLDDKYKVKKSLASPESGHIAPEKHIEESSKPVVIDTSGQEVDDETDEQHDPRSEQAITDEVSKSMPNWREREYNQVMTKQGEKIEELQQKLKAAEERNKDVEYKKLEEKLIRLEETNERLLNENKQYSEAVVKHGFQSANNVKIDPQQIRNYEEMITSLELMLKQKNAKIEDLQQKIESFSHIDHITAEAQHLELDVKKFVGIIFANRGNRVTLVHDGEKIVNITGGENIGR